MNRARLNIMAAGIAGLLTLGALPASAESITEVRAHRIAEPTEVAVSFADLDLDSAEGLEVLHYRLANAAREACGSSDLRRVGNVRIASRNEACARASLSRAMADIPSAQVASTR